MRERKRKITLLGSIIIFDHVLKVLALRSGIALINKGVGFGILLSCLPVEARRFGGAKSGYLAILLTGLSFLLLFIYLKRKSVGVWLVLAGGISNLLDRVFYGGVVDFIRLPLIPVFNFADIAITAGTFLIFIDFLKLKKV